MKKVPPQMMDEENDLESKNITKETAEDEGTQKIIWEKQDPKPDDDVIALTAKQLKDATGFDALTASPKDKALVEKGIFPPTGEPLDKAFLQGLQGLKQDSGMDMFSGKLGE